MSSKQHYANDLKEFFSTYSITLPQLDVLIQENGIENNLFQKIGVPKEKANWILVGSKIALLSNVAFQNYSDGAKEYLLEAEKGCYKALSQVEVPQEKRNQFSTLARRLQQPATMKEKSFIIDQINDLIEEVATEKYSSRKTKILFLSSNPLNESRIKIDKEAREVEEGLRRASQRDHFEFKLKVATRPKDFLRAVLDENPAILHFSGHGVEEGIALEDDNGNAKLVSSEAISQFFSLFSDTIKCVVLNSCYSEKQALGIAKYIEHVIGMKEAMPDSTAIAFAISFYDAIGAGKNYEFAYSYALKSLPFIDVGGDTIPVFIKNAAFLSRIPGKE